MIYTFVFYSCRRKLKTFYTRSFTLLVVTLYLCDTLVMYFCCPSRHVGDVFLLSRFTVMTYMWCTFVATSYPRDRLTMYCCHVYSRDILVTYCYCHVYSRDILATYWCCAMSLRHSSYVLFLDGYTYSCSSRQISRLGGNKWTFLGGNIRLVMADTKLACRLYNFEDLHKACTFLCTMYFIIYVFKFWIRGLLS